MLSLLLGMLLAAVPAPAGQPSLHGDSMYVWSPAVEMTDGVDDRGQQQRLLRFCSAPGVEVRRLYFLVRPSRWNEPSLARFLADAHRSGIDVYAVPRGTIQNAWIAPFPKTGACDPEPVLAWLETILRFNREHPDAGFAGVQLDIEPHAARSGRKHPWKENKRGLADSKRNRRIAREFLTLLEAVRDRISEERSGVRFAVTIPSWYDLDEKYESYVFRHGGVKKPWAMHVMDRVDFVTLMNYVGASGRAGRKQAVKAISREVRYGPAESLFQTAGRSGGGKKRRTLYREGEAGYLRLRDHLGKKFADDPNFLGCGVHHWLDAYGSGDRGWPKHD